MVYTIRLYSSKCSLFRNSKVFGSYIIHILYAGCAQIKKKNRRQKVNVTQYTSAQPFLFLSKATCFD